LRDIPVAVVDLGDFAEQLLFSLLVGQISPDLVPVLLGLQHGRQMYPRPHLLARQLAAIDQHLVPDVSQDLT
jgi:hypothetical protein